MRSTPRRLCESAAAEICCLRRPHPLVEKPRVLIQLSFMTEGGSAVDLAVLSDLSRRLGIAAPERHARHHAMKWGKGTLRWERHTEFSTYLW
ncbi:DUF3422 family protein, partial [Mesorhizobium sp.]|uniref:DUF3422 family protein n=1 Tax=Mesorhizobium sp. TaxID=1871066 RepID=UPI0025E8AD80